MMETILYVEDDLSLIDGLEYTMETNGYSLDNARTVKQAIRIIDEMREANIQGSRCSRTSLMCFNA